MNTREAIMYNYDYLYYLCNYIHNYMHKVKSVCNVKNCNSRTTLASCNYYQTMLDH